MALATIVLVLSILFPTVSNAALNEDELAEYLLEIGLTQDELEEQLMIHHGLELTDFDSVEELIEFLGPIIDEDNLQALLDLYELTLEELTMILEEYGETLEDYVFINDLEYAIDFYINFEDVSWEEILAELEALFAEFDLSNEDLEALFDHFSILDLDNPAFEERLLNLEERALVLPDFESATELTAEEIAEILAIYSEMMDLFELDAQYFLIVGKDKASKQPISLQTLITLESLEGYNLLIELYNFDGEFLADMIITAEMFGSELIKQPTEDLKEVAEIVQKAPENVQTEKGAKMPKTASNSMQNGLIGLSMMLAAGLIYRRMKIKGA